MREDSFMGTGVNRRAWVVALLLLTHAARAGGADAEAEKRSYLPLIPESTYSFDCTFKGKAQKRSLTVKPVTRKGVEAFYFLDGAERGTPLTIVGTNVFAHGLCLRQGGGVAAVPCFWLRDIDGSDFKRDAINILKEPPEPGQRSELRVSPRPEQGRDIKFVFSVVGTEQVVVPAGTFKDCVKIMIEEVHTSGPDKAETVGTGHVWLAKGVGVVKWVRTTGRTEVLTGYRLGPAPKPDKVGGGKPAGGSRP